MKTVLRGVLYLLLFAVSVRPALAADAVTGGIEVGANMGKASVTGSDAAGVTIGAKAGLAIGGFVEVPANKIFSVQPEVLYSQTPTTVSDSGEPADTEHIDSIEIPILARINLPSQSKAHAYLLAGPGFGFITRFKETQANGKENDFKDNVEKANVSIIAGVGVQVGHFGIEGRYDGGLRNINKNLNGNDAGAKDRLSIKSRSFTVLARWAFK